MWHANSFELLLLCSARDAGEVRHILLDHRERRSIIINSVKLCINTPYSNNRQITQHFC